MQLRAVPHISAQFIDTDHFNRTNCDDSINFWNSKFVIRDLQSVPLCFELHSICPVLYCYGYTVKPVLSDNLKEDPKICFQDRAGQKYRILQYFRPALSYDFKDLFVYF